MLLDLPPAGLLNHLNHTDARALQPMKHKPAETHGPMHTPLISLCASCHISPCTRASHQLVCVIPHQPMHACLSSALFFGYAHHTIPALHGERARGSLPMSQAARIPGRGRSKSAFLPAHHVFLQQHCLLADSGSLARCCITGTGIESQVWNRGNLPEGAYLTKSPGMLLFLM